MEAKKKAEELVDRFKPFAYEGLSTIEENAKQCALICVDEIIESEPTNMDGNNWDIRETSIDSIKYWLEVKQEILNL